MIVITVCDMRAAGKPGYVAKLEGKERFFLNAKSYSGHGVSAKEISYELTEEAHGLYEVCDANYGNRKRRLSYVAVAPHGWKEFEDLAAAKAFLNPPAPVEASLAAPVVATPPATVAPAYPGLKAAAPEEAPAIDVEVAKCKFKGEPYLQVKMKSDNAFKLFMPEMKQRVHGRQWNDASRSWLIPADGVMLLREMIEECTIRTNGIRMAMHFQLSPGAKAMMAMED